MEAKGGREASKREKISKGWCFLTSNNVTLFYMLFILQNEGRGRMWSEQGRKEIIRMTFPDFCQCHTVLPIRMMFPNLCHLYTDFTEWRQRKDVKQAREKRDHKDDVSWLLPMSHCSTHKDDVSWLLSFAYSSTSYLFYGMKTEEGREASKREKRS